MSALVLRPAGPADTPAIVVLVHAAYGHYVERLGGPPRPLTDDYDDVVARLDVTLAERDGQLVGLLVLDPDDDEGFTVDNVAVDPSAQGTGVGRALLERAEAEARRAGCDAIHLYTHGLMTENQELYRRIGYEEYKRIPHGEHSVVFMRKALGSAP